jgi:hypothetical protein
MAAGGVVNADLETKFAVHEAICATRYDSILEKLSDGKKRMAKIEILLYAVIAAVLLGPGVAAELVKKIFGI